MYFPKAEELANIAVEAEKAGEKEKASEYYLSVHFLLLKRNIADALQAKLSSLSYLTVPNASVRTATICLGEGQGSVLQGCRVSIP